MKKPYSNKAAVTGPSWRCKEKKSSKKPYKKLLFHQRATKKGMNNTVKTANIPRDTYLNTLRFSILQFFRYNQYLITIWSSKQACFGFCPIFILKRIGICRNFYNSRLSICKVCKAGPGFGRSGSFDFLVSCEEMLLMLFCRWHVALRNALVSNDTPQN